MKSLIRDGDLWRTVLLSLVLLIFICHAEAGALKWELKTQSVEASTSDTQAEIQFAFTNTSNVAVAIGKIQTSCGCTTVELTKKKYEPGESGAIRAIFIFGGRKGAQEKSIIVPFADGSQDVLTLKVNIPDSVKTNKEMLTWEAGDPPETQSFEISVVQPGASVKSVKSLTPHFTASLKEIDQEKVFRVEVTPTKTDRPVNGTIRVEVADPGSRAIYLKVRIE